MEDIKFALLIDSDNISADYIKIILDELSKYELLLIKESMGTEAVPIQANGRMCC